MKSIPSKEKVEAIRVLLGEQKGVERKLDQLGRIVIPKEFCKCLNIKPGDEVEMRLFENGLLITKVE